MPATIGVIEAAIWKKTWMPPRTSVQQIVDCSRGEGNVGCSKGNIANSLRYINRHGLVSNSSYPYKAKDGFCNHAVTDDVSKQCLRVGELRGIDVTVIGSKRLDGLFERIQEAPVAVGIDVIASEWPFYRGGILQGLNCTEYPIHFMLLVGYGVSEDGINYWTVRNSWGSDWGEHGFARMVRDPHVKIGAGFCNIMLNPAYIVTFEEPLISPGCK
ncbi:hypothetical protein FOL47_010213 [Perkinsus chesapeaki]|uniref:Peptidase C1A papain C-terminal domain-containing protein n=1 Tax=Perkinsus chesapeaki TaxID=330153 RepID=A0A7J6L467_PERCH|nr:hypothetical protein FOL47_010213 [Perkinsus chesapeaki]